MKIERKLITPEIAKQYLGINYKNRRVKQPLIVCYSNDMLNGRWKENTGDFLRVSKTGRLLDGQHRLLAVIKANKPIYLWFASEIDDDVFDVIDTGSSRNATDIFYIAGVPNGNVIPSIISMFYLLKTGKAVGTQKYNKPTNAVLLELYQERERYWQSVSAKAVSWYKAFAKILTPSTLGGMYAFLHSISERDADNYFHQLATGLDISNSTIALLRQRLIQDKTSNRKITITLKHALIIKTWNAFRNKETLKVLKFDSSKESFPKPI